jgi:hypothetical protein
MTLKRTLSVSLRIVETIETDDDKQPPSLPPFPIDVEGCEVSETTEVIRPLAKVLPMRSLRKVAG